MSYFMMRSGPAKSPHCINALCPTQLSSIWNVKSSIVANTRGMKVGPRDNGISGFGNLRMDRYQNSLVALQWISIFLRLDKKYLLSALIWRIYASFLLNSVMYECKYQVNSPSQALSAFSLCRFDSAGNVEG